MNKTMKYFGSNLLYPYVFKTYTKNWFLPFAYLCSSRKDLKLFIKIIKKEGSYLKDQDKEKY